MDALRFLPSISKLGNGLGWFERRGFLSCFRSNCVQCGEAFRPVLTRDSENENTLSCLNFIQAEVLPAHDSGRQGSIALTSDLAFSPRCKQFGGVEFARPVPRAKCRTESEAMLKRSQQ